MPKEKAKKPLSCYLIGQTGFLVKCATQLTKQNFQILGIISEDKKVIQWAQKNNITILSLDQLNKIKTKSFDFLFSIINNVVLSPTLLKKSKTAAINYHDSILPKYAGVHAASWAILNGEKQHGVTWHIMVKKIDAGEILEQETVQIEKNDTTEDLNLKCLEAGLSSFSRLLNQINTGSYKKSKQNQKLRSFHGQHQKPHMNGIIDWSWPAEKIYQLFLACQFGQESNPFSSIKCNLDNDWFVVTSMKILSKKSTKPYGKIISYDEKGIEVSTSTYNILLQKLISIGGKEPEPKPCAPTIKNTNNLTIYKSYGSLYQQLSTDIDKFEHFYVKQLQNCSFLKFPFYNIPFDKEGNSFEYSFRFNQQNSKNLNNISGHLILTCLLSYLCQLNQQHNGTVALALNQNDHLPLVSDIVPLTIDFDPTLSLSSVLEKCTKLHSLHQKGCGFQKDIFMRYPELKRLNSVWNDSEIPITIAITDGIRKSTNNIKSNAAFIIDSKTQAIILRLRIKKGHKRTINALCKTIEQHLSLLLHQFINNPQITLAKASFLSKTEYEKVTTKYNKTNTKLKYSSIIEAIREQTQKHPNKIAIVDDKQSITYQSLEDKSNQFANYLISNNISNGDRIALLCEKQINTFISILGILKIGAIYVPLNPQNPKQYTEQLLKNCTPNLIITNTEISNSFKTNKTRNIGSLKLDHYSTQLQIAYHVQPNDIAYIIYTSGSTGIPKGVQISHESLLNMAISHVHDFNVTSNDRIIQFVPLSFDASVADWTMAFLAGASLYLFPNTDLLDTSKLKQLIHSNKITLGQFTNKLLESLPAEILKPLKTIVGGGSIFTQSTVIKWGNTGKNIINAYGPTEACVCATYKKCLFSNSLHTIGKPVANTKVYILDSWLNPVPIGIPGEICIGGLGLSTGYLFDKKLTKTKFVQNPFDKTTKLYLTGDIGVRLQNGEIYFIGRQDDQIKINGYRIEPEEIKKCLLKIANNKIKDVTIIYDDKLKCLVAFIVPKSKYYYDIFDNLQPSLNKYLPKYMLPKHYIPIKALPLTSSGKINFSILKNKLTSFLDDGQTIKPKRNSSVLEKLFFEIWRHVLGSFPTGDNNNFFVAGGDSIKAMELSLHLEEIGYNLSMGEIYKAQYFTSMLNSIKKINVKNIEKTITTNSPFNLSPIQLWFFENTPKNLLSSVAHTKIFSYPAPLTKNELKNIFNLLLEKHVNLRLQFSTEKSDEIKQYYAATPVVLENLNITQAGKIDPHKLTDVINTNVNYLNFLNNTLISVATAYTKHKNLLILTIHHSLIDYISWKILSNDLNLLLKGKHLSQTQELYYENWIKFLFTDVAKIAYKEKNYWLSQLRNSQPIQTKTHVDKKNNIGLLDYKIANNAHIQQAHKLKQLSNLSYKELLIHSLLNSLNELYQQPNLLIHVENHGRYLHPEQLSLLKTIGWFTTLYPLHLPIHKLNAIDTIIEQLKFTKNLLRNIPSHGMGYGILKYFLKDEQIINADKTHQQIPVCFNYVGEVNGENSDNSNTKQPFLLHTQTLFKYQLVLQIAINKGSFYIHCLYDEINFHRETIRRFLNKFEKNLFEFSAISPIHSKKITIPSDFPLTSDLLTEKQLNYYLSKYDINTIYSTTHVQQGLLYQSLKNPAIYLVQTILNFTGVLNLNLFVESWERITGNLDILNTVIVHEQLQKPLQIVIKHAKQNIHAQDLSKINNKEQLQTIQTYLEKQQKNISFEYPVISLAIFALDSEHYTFIITAHHLFLDGWSMQILLDLLQTDYLNHFNKHHKKTNFSSFNQYKNYVQWLANQNYQKASEFFKNYLLEYQTQDYLSQHQILNSDQRQEHTITVSSSLTKSIQLLSQNESVTLNTIFQTAWTLLLNWLGRSDDIMYGLIFSGRTLLPKNLKNTIGVMATALPLRIKLSKNDLIKELLQKVQNNLTHLSKYQFISPAHIKEYLSSSVTHPLYESIIAFENYPNLLSHKHLFSSENVQILDGAHYPLCLTIVPKNDTYVLKANFANNHFELNKIELILEEFHNILKLICTNLNTTVSELNLLSKKLSEQTAKEPHIEHLKPIQLLVNKAMQLHSNNVALSCENEKISYQELDKQINTVCQNLLKHGLKQKQIVAILMPPSKEMVITLLATLKLQCAFLIINPTYPAKRKQFMLNGAKPTLVVGTASTDNHFIKNHSYLDFISLCNQNEKLQQIPWNGSLTDPMYVVYTSGSTGKPKGILVKQQTISNLLYNNLIPINNKNHVNVLQFADCSFDVAIQEIFYSITKGFTLHLANEQIKQSPIELLRFIEKHQINILFLPTRMLAILVEAFFATSHNKPLIDLQYIIVAGESLVITSEIKQFFKINEQIRLINQYGPAETHVVSSYLLPKDSSTWPQSPSIGKPIDNVQFQVIDHLGRPLPPNTLGELIISGTNLAQGYLNVDNNKQDGCNDNSQQKQLPTRYYETGDIAYYDKNGYWYFAGREDDQVKIRGYRVELAEIEKTLMQSNLVKACVVIASSSNLTSKLNLFYIPKTTKDLKNEILTFLKNELPAYMIPSTLIAVNELPATQSGKIDKNQLQEQLNCKPEEKNKVQQIPIDATTTKLIQIIKKTISIQNPNLETTFFELGGDSLDLLSLLSKIHEEFGVEIPVNSDLGNSTISNISNLIKLYQKGNINTKNWVPQDSLVSLKNSPANGTPIFLIHPVGGTTFWYNPLCHIIEYDGPIYGIQDPSILAGKPIFNSLKEMADFYILLIQTVFTNGTCFLGGASGGTNIAVEIAKQLRKSSIKVKGILSFDGWAKYPKDIDNRPTFEKIMREQYLNITNQLNDTIDIDRLLAIQWHNAQLITKHKLNTIYEKFYLFKANHIIPELINFDDDINNLWDNFMKNTIETFNIEGNHKTILQLPFVNKLAKILTNLLTSLSKE